MIMPYLQVLDNDKAMKSDDAAKDRDVRTLDGGGGPEIAEKKGCCS